jgi:hypothetical protein
MVSIGDRSAVGRPCNPPVCNTPLSWAIRSIRWRLRKRQIAFSILIVGHSIAPLVSRWESGQVVPGLKNLLSLLKLAETPQERTPIIDALKVEGIDELIGNLPAYFMDRRNGKALLQKLSIGSETAVFNAKS